MKRLRKLLSGGVAAAMALAMSVGLLAQPVSAASVTYVNPDLGRETSLGIHYHQQGIDFEGVEFKAYKIADMDETVSFSFVDRFAEYPVDFKDAMTASDWTNLAETLAGYASRDGLEPDYAGVTDSRGRYDLTGLDASLYLVIGGSHQREYRTIDENGQDVLHRVYYHAAPFLVATPSLEDGEWVYDVEISPKFTVSEDELIDKRVLKVWDDAGYESQRPGALTFDLVRDNEVYETVELTAANSWRYQWDELDNTHQWRIVEHTAGNYTVSTRQEGITYVVTNRYNYPTPVTPPSRPDPRPDPDPGTDPDPVIPTPPTTDIEDPDTPKTEIPTLPEEPDKPDPSEPGNPGTPGTPEPVKPDIPETEIPDPDVPLTPLPQTGQLWWPVPVMAVLGCACFFIGWALRRRPDEG